MSGRWAISRLGVILTAVLLVALVLVPIFVPDPDVLRLLFVTLCLVTCSVAWNLLGGFAGQVSFGFAVFYGIGAYTTALLMNTGLNPYPAFLAAAVMAAVASLVVGLPTLRLRGPYFAIATIGVSEAVRVIMNNLGFTGGASGYRIVEHRAFSQAEQYFSALGLAALAVAISFVVSRANFGLALRAIRQDEDAAADLGVNGFAYKVMVHALAAALTGAAGGVAARYAAFIHPGGVFGFETSVRILLMPVIGGVGTIWGPVIGAGVLGIVEEELVASFPQIHLLLYGGLLMVIVLAEPGGILGAARNLIWRIRARKTRAHTGSREADQALWHAPRGNGN